MLKRCGLIDTFKEFNIIFSRKERNHTADSLEVSTSMFVPINPSDEKMFKVKTLFRPTILNSEDSLQFFENDEQALIFFECFEGEEEKSASLEPKDEVNYFDQEGILNLKNNYFL